MSEYIIDMGASIPNPNGGLLCANVSQLREEIVRCADCKHYEYWEFRDGRTAHDCARGGDYLFDTEPTRFCAWGERRFTTCKCGKEIELGDRESAVCPSCGRTVRE